MKKWLPVLMVSFLFACAESESTALFESCAIDDDCDVGQECGQHVCAKTEGCWILWGCTDSEPCTRDNVCRKAADACAKGDCGQVVKVPAGSFEMGCADDDPNCHEMSRPQHTVTIAKPFYIDRTEVSVQEYAACTAEVVKDKDGVVTSGCSDPNFEVGACNWEGALDLPVVCVTWKQANAYCAWNGKRLCTEAEWEYAARGPESKVYPWDGNEECEGEPDCDKTSFVVSSISTDPVGCGDTLTMPAVPEDANLCDKTTEGAYYMAGNAWEWTQDFLHDSYAGAPTDGSEWLNDLGGRRVARGGRPDFDTPPDLKLHRRFAEYPTVSHDTLGFRCCAEFKCDVDTDCAGTGMECFEKANGVKTCRKAPAAE
ncbi:MAG TPA: SUMF1/EgtB/PvdO family nonheme iron enzyme [Myxococcota bacterium]|nr:SUMF1/EgtB/PvdO family nonheme iron enzyme [Myxococcota bacterium]